MSRIYLPWTASRARMKEARDAQKNRHDILRALSHGQVSRRDLIIASIATVGAAAALAANAGSAKAEDATTSSAGQAASGTVYTGDVIEGHLPAKCGASREAMGTGASR